MKYNRKFLKVAFSTTFVGVFLVIVVCSSTSLVFGNSYLFDWRTFHKTNTDILWVGGSERPIFERGKHNISHREYCCAMAYNDIGGRYSRSIVSRIARSDIEASNSAIWLNYASARNYFRTPSLVNFNEHTARNLCLILGLELSDQPLKDLKNLNSERFAKCEVLSGYLYAVAKYEKEISDELEKRSETLDELDRIFPIAVGAANPLANREFLLDKLNSNLVREKALALLALSKLPATDRSDFPNWTQNVVGFMESANDTAFMFIVAAAIYNSGSIDAYRIIEKYISNPDELLGASCALAGGAILSASDISALMQKVEIPSVVRAHFLLGASNRKGYGISPEYFYPFLKHDEAEIRKLAAISLGFQGDANAIPHLRRMSQDASYDVRACAVIGAALIKSPYSYGVFKANAFDKHHQEISALASILGAFLDHEKAVRYTQGVDEYIFPREQGVALLALGVASPGDFKKVAAGYRKSLSAYQRQLLSIGGLSTGDASWLKPFAAAIESHHNFRPFGDPVALRKEILVQMLPPVFRCYAEYSWER